mgnify:CR=1 FL=1
MQATVNGKFEPFEFTADGVRQRATGCNDGGRGCLRDLLYQAQAQCYNLGQPNNNTIIEVGSWAGAHAIQLADLGFLVYCVDHWRGGPRDSTGCIARALGSRTIFQGFCRNVGDRLLRSIFPCVGSSETWAAVWPYPVMGIFIDADHSYEQCKADIEAWWPHVLPRGILCGHDYEMFPGVKQAADEFGIDGHDREVWWKWKPTETP